MVILPGEKGERQEGKKEMRRAKPNETFLRYPITLSPIRLSRLSFAFRQ